MSGAYQQELLPGFDVELATSSSAATIAQVAGTWCRSNKSISVAQMGRSAASARRRSSDVILSQTPHANSRSMEIGSLPFCITPGFSRCQQVILAQFHTTFQTA